MVKAARKIQTRKVSEGHTHVCGCLECEQSLADIIERAGGQDDTLHKLRNLLAIIHSDGGHYVSDHGLDKACKDAEELVLRERPCGETAWVSAEERLPEAQKAIDEYPLLGMVEGWSRPMKVWYFGPDIKWRAEGIYGDPPNVTHWQPLPSPPTAESTKEKI